MSELGCIAQGLPSLASLVSVPLQWIHDELIAEKQEIVDQHQLRGDEPPVSARLAVKHQKLTRFAAKNTLPLAVSLIIRSIGRREACPWESASGTKEFYSLGNTVVSDVVDTAYMIAEGRPGDIWSETQIGFSLATLISAYRNGLPDSQMPEQQDSGGIPPAISTSKTKPAPASDVDILWDNDEYAGYQFVMTLDPSQFSKINAGPDQGGETLVRWPLCAVHGNPSEGGATTAVDSDSERVSAAIHFGWILADQPDDKVKTCLDDQ